MRYYVCVYFKNFGARIFTQQDFFLILCVKNKVSFCFI